MLHTRLLDNRTVVDLESGLNPFAVSSYPTKLQAPFPDLCHISLARAEDIENT